MLKLLSKPGPRVQSFHIQNGLAANYWVSRVTTLMVKPSWS
jgi:hypothetical protein